MRFIPPIVLKDMRVYYEERLAKQPDVMTAKDVGALAGLHLGARFVMDPFLSDEAPFERFLEG